MKLEVKLKDHSYPIYIERHALEHIKDYIDPERKYAIVTDDNVPKQWVDLLKDQLQDASVITFEHGEKTNLLQRTNKSCSKLFPAISAEKTRSSLWEAVS